MDRDFPGLGGKRLPVPVTGDENRAIMAKVSLNRRFFWRVKPQPFGLCFPETTYAEDWKRIELQQRDILFNEISHAQFKPINHVDGDEVEATEFMCRGTMIRCERFLNVDQTAENPFDASKVAVRTEAKFATIAQDFERAPLEAIQMVMAGYHYHQLTAGSGATKSYPLDEDVPSLNQPTDKYRKALVKLYREQESWPVLVQAYNTALQTIESGSVSNSDLEARCLDFIRKRWKRWKFGSSNGGDDSTFKNDCNEILATTPDLLRTVPDMCLYIALDKNDKVLVHLDPFGVTRTFGEAVKTRMERDTILWSFLKPPQREVNTRHDSAERNRVRNGLEENQCGTDHIGHWIQKGYATTAPVLTKDTNDVEKKMNIGCRLNAAFQEYMQSTVGTITRLLDYEFGYLEPELREEFREVYRESPESGKFPPLNAPPHEETYCLRAILCNMPTDEHQDSADWVGGLTGLVQLGDFTGGGMVLKQLGIILPGYRSGCSLQFRGGILKHYIAPWTGTCRFAFDHTTHEAVRTWVRKDKEAREAGVVDRAFFDDFDDKGVHRDMPKKPDDGDNQGRKRKRATATGARSGVKRVQCGDNDVDGS